MSEFLVENPPTEEQFLEAVDNAVAARGEDFIYPSTHCTYNGGIPCLYGKAMSDLGFPVPAELEGQSINVVLEKMFGWHRHSPVAMAADAGQEEQDTQKPWGYARDAMWAEYNKRTQ